MLCGWLTWRLLSGDVAEVLHFGRGAPAFALRLEHVTPELVAVAQLQDTRGKALDPERGYTFEYTSKEASWLQL